MAVQVIDPNGGSRVARMERVAHEIMLTEARKATGPLVFGYVSMPPAGIPWPPKSPPIDVEDDEEVAPPPPRPRLPRAHL